MKKCVGSSITKQVFCSKRFNTYQRFREKVHARKTLRRRVNEFLERDDNSRMMQEKNDNKKAENRHMQKRVFNDSMPCLHMTFVTETSEKISLATFCRLRPKLYVSGLKNMTSVGTKVPSSPDEFARQLKENSINVNEICSDINVGMVEYEQWKKVEMPDGKKKKKIIEKEITKEEFISAIQIQIVEFQEHVVRVKDPIQSSAQSEGELTSGTRHHPDGCCRKFYLHVCRRSTERILKFIYSYSPPSSYLLHSRGWNTDTR